MRINRRGGRDIGERKGERKEGVRGEMREKREKEEERKRGKRGERERRGDNPFIPFSTTKFISK